MKYSKIALCIFLLKTFILSANSETLPSGSTNNQKDSLVFTLESAATYLDSSLNPIDSLLVDSLTVDPHGVDSLSKDSSLVVSFSGTLSDSISAKNTLDSLPKHFAVADTALAKFSFAVFTEIRLQFIHFEDRKYFQQNLDTLYYRARRDTFNIQQGIGVSKVDFQKVNLSFPVALGVQFPLGDFFRVAFSAGYMYASEEALLLEGSRTTQFLYSLSWFPMSYEIQLNFSELLINSPDFPQLFLAMRINQILGKAKIEYQGKNTQTKGFDFMGAGFAIGGRRKIMNMLELETQLGLDFQSVQFDKNWRDLWPESSVNNPINPQLNTFWFALRIVYKI